MRIAAALPAVTLLLGAACSRDATPTATRPTPTSVSLDVVSGGGQSAQAGKQLANPIVVKVVDASLGFPVPGYLVNWVITSGGGTTFVGASETNWQGIAQNYWTLGSAVGTQTLEVRAISSVNGQPLTFATISATATGTGIIAGHSYHFEQRYDGAHATTAIAWNFTQHVQVVLVDDQTGVVAQSMGFWVTSNNGGCSFTDSTITCPNAGTVHIDFQQFGLNGVDNPAFRPAIDLPVD
jgi:hypothetical protein